MANIYDGFGNTWHIDTSSLTVGDADYGDITVSSSGAVWTINANTVTYGQIQGMTTNRILGRTTASTGDIEELTVGTGLTLAAGDLSCSITQYTDEMAEDAVATMIQNGTGISWSYDDGAGTFTPTVSLSSFSTTDLSEGTNLYYTDERAQDAVGSMVSSEFTYTDATPELSINSISYTKISGLGTLATQSGTFSGTSSGTNTGDQTITLTGDVTGSGTGSFATTITSGAVSLSKMADMATASILGRNTGGTGSPEVLSASTTKTLLSLNNVENTALSTWAGTSNITSVGTLSSGDATAIVSAASTSTAGKIEIATQSEMEAGSDTGRAVVPGRQQYHPSACKAWVHFTGTGTVTITASYNTTSITDDGTGTYSWNIATDFSSANWCCVGAHQDNSSALISMVIGNGSQAVGSIQVITVNSAVAVTDCPKIHLAGFGDQ